MGDVDVIGINGWNLWLGFMGLSLTWTWKMKVDQTGRHACFQYRC